MAKVTGGAKFTMAIRELTGKLNADSLKVGFAEAATYPDGQSVPLIAAVNEFGARRRAASRRGRSSAA
jgi:hypothetical protein